MEIQACRAWRRRTFGKAAESRGKLLAACLPSSDEIHILGNHSKSLFKMD